MFLVLNRVVKINVDKLGFCNSCCTVYFMLWRFPSLACVVRMHFCKENCLPKRLLLKWLFSLEDIPSFPFQWQLNIFGYSLPFNIGDGAHQDDYGESPPGAIGVRILALYPKLLEMYCIYFDHLTDRRFYLLPDYCVFFVFCFFSIRKLLLYF